VLGVFGFFFMDTTAAWLTYDKVSAHVYCKIDTKYNALV
jgi:hypothetical protein